MLSQQSGISLWNFWEKFCKYLYAAKKNGARLPGPAARQATVRVKFRQAIWPCRREDGKDRLIIGRIFLITRRWAKNWKGILKMGGRLNRGSLRYFRRLRRRIASVACAQSQPFLRFLECKCVWKYGRSPVTRTLKGKRKIEPFKNVQSKLREMGVS